MPPSSKTLQSISSTRYSPTENLPKCHPLTRYPLQEIQQQKNIQTNSLEVVDNYPSIHVTRFDGNKKTKYLYKIFRLGYYPPNVKQTVRSCYLIPNGYLVSIKIRGIDIMAETQYDSNDKVIYTLTWDGSNGEKQSVSSNRSASNVATLFLQVCINNLIITLHVYIVLYI